MNIPIKNKKKIVNKDNISEKIKKEIKIICKKYPKIKQKIKNLKDLDKKLYYAMVWVVTESQPLHILENSDKRGWKSYHLDHIYPISMGFKENISPEKIGNIKNLRFIPFEENIKKGSTITSDSLRSLRKIKRLLK
jgi:hypothetical protein